MDPEGYINLNRLVTRAWAEGFYQYPTVHGNMLQEHSSGLVVISGCSDSLLNCTLLGGKSNGPKRDRASSFDVGNAERLVRKFKSIFGDRYYLEVQQFPELDRTCTLNAILAELSMRCSVPLVATADCHYPHPDDNEMQKILHAAGRGSGSIAAQEQEWEYNIRLTPPLSDRFILKRLVSTGLSKKQAVGAIRATTEIAERCSVTLPKNDWLRMPLAAGYNTAKDMIWDWLRDGWAFRAAENPRMRAHRRQYTDRLKYEMELVTSKDFLDYFLMLSDAVRFAKDSGIVVGPARGSAAASLTCYLLRITEVDPLAHPHMMFERFLDPARLDLPDVDLDFADDRRGEIWDYMGDKYGADHIGTIGNFTRYRGKNSVNDVARVYRIPRWEADVVKNLIIERSGGDSRFDASLEDTFTTFPAAAEVLDRHPDLAYAMRLEGGYAGMSVHAAGLIISNTPITDTCATYERKGKTVLAYDKKDAEYLGMLKADFLGLSTLGMIGIALGLIGMSLEELYRTSLDDEKVLQAFRDGDVVGIFQFEGRATRLVCAEVVPTNFQELSDINALSRPGPLFSGMKMQYVEVRHGRRKRELLHPIVDEVTEWTQGQIVYQEQVLAIIRDLGGFSVNEVGGIRKVISQKLGEASFNKLLGRFVDGCKKLHDIDEQLANKIWKYMITSATYSFNISHCVSYSMLGFWCMWLKCYHPTAFYAATMSKTADREKWPRLLRDAQRHGIEILPPDPTESVAGWTVAGERSIRAGFDAVPGIGGATSSAILEIRSGDPEAMQEWKDLGKVKGIGPKTVQKIQEFATSDDPFGLEIVGNTLRAIRALLQEGKGQWGSLPRPTHTSDQIPRDAENLLVTWLGIVKKIEYKDILEDARSRTGAEYEETRAALADPHLTKAAVLHGYDDGEEEVYLRINRWNYPKFQDIIAGINPGHDVVLIKGLKRKGFGISMQIRQIFVIDPEDDDEDETTYEEDDQ